MRHAALITLLAASALGPPASAGDDLAAQPVVVERQHVACRVEEDGSSRCTLSKRLRVQTEAGVRAAGEVVHVYNPASQRLDVRFVRVVKPDGTIATAPPDATREVPAPVLRAAPVYSDDRERHVMVPELRPGDVLEHEAVLSTAPSPFGGAFWTAQRFNRTTPALDVRYEVDVPRSREVRVGGSKIAGRPEISEFGSRRAYRWRWSWSVADVEHERFKPSPSDAFDVSLTSFQRWEDFAAAWLPLARDAMRPAPDVRAKAVELTRGLATASEKVEALYAFVALEVRYVAVPVGKWSVLPRPASTTLKNRYGDCKDKHALLAALLESVGIESITVLAGVGGIALDPALPNPAGLDHVLTAVPLDGFTMWLDSTQDAAPPGWIRPELRGKKVLVVPAQGDARVAEMPASAGVVTEMVIDLDGRVDDAGGFTARCRLSLRGDMEVLLRSALRSTGNGVLPTEDWRSRLELFGIPGEVTDVKATDLWDLLHPLSFEVQLRERRPPGASWELRLPTAVDLPRAAKDKPIAMGGPLRLAVYYRVELPPGRIAAVPEGDRIERDFASYRARYRFEKGVVQGERSLTSALVQIPATRAAEYASFSAEVAKALKKSFVAERAAAEKP